jgi:hypothetical protein
MDWKDFYPEKVVETEPIPQAVHKDVDWNSDSLQNEPKIQGVGVLHCPAGSQQLAEEIARRICQGAILYLPSERDDNGNLLWDFRIEGGDPGQVIVRPIGEER